MSSVKRVAQAIREQDRDTAHRMVREIEYADVRQVNPLLAEMHSSSVVLDDEDLTLGQWARSYDSAVGIAPGDTLAVKQMRGGGWLVTDIINDEAEVLDPSPPRSTTPETGATVTPAAGSAGSLVKLDSSSSQTVVIDEDLGLADGQQIDFIRLGTGSVTFQQGTGATLNGTPGLKMRARYSAASVLCVGTNAYVVVGDLSA